MTCHAKISKSIMLNNQTGWAYTTMRQGDAATRA